MSNKKEKRANRKSNIDHQNYHTHRPNCKEHRNMGRSRSRGQDKFLRLPNVGTGFNYQSVIWNEKEKKNEE
jgi:hypothetical protein